MKNFLTRATIPQKVFRFIVTVDGSDGFITSVSLNDVISMIQRSKELRVISVSIEQENNEIYLKPHRHKMIGNDFNVRGCIEFQFNNTYRYYEILEKFESFFDIVGMESWGPPSMKAQIEFQLNGNWAEEVKPGMKTLIMENLWEYVPYNEQLDTFWQLDPESVKIYFLGRNEYV